MNTPVTYPLALLLCENLYDVPTDSLYVNNTLIDTNGRKCNWNREEEYEYFPNPISAPTIADVVMWLNDTYGIWIHSSCDVDGNFYPKISFSKEENWFNLELRSKMNAGNREIFIVDYKSPTLAYEAAILYTLTNLI